MLVNKDRFLNLKNILIKEYNFSSDADYNFKAFKFITIKGYKGVSLDVTYNKESNSVYFYMRGDQLDNFILLCSTKNFDIFLEKLILQLKIFDINTKKLIDSNI
jgi:hypothetical protein